MGIAKARQAKPAKKEEKEVRQAKIVEQTFGYAPSPALPGQILAQNESGLLSDIALKSQRIIKMNFELTEKLNENERNIENLNEDLQVLYGRLQEHGKDKAKIQGLMQRINDLGLYAANLKHNIDLLRSNLENREKYINVLKRAYGSRASMPGTTAAQDREIKELREKSAMLQNNVQILRQDISVKKKHIDFLKNFARKKQVAFYSRQLRESTGSINELSGQLVESRKKNLELMEKVDSLSHNDRLRLQHKKEVEALKDRLLAEQEKNLALKGYSREATLKMKEALESVKQAHAHEKGESARLAEEKKALINEIQSLTARIRELEKTANSGSRLMLVISKLRNELKNKDATLLEIKKSNSFLASRTEKAIGEANKFAGQAKVATRANEQLVAERQKAEAELRKLKNIVVALKQDYDKRIESVRLEQSGIDQARLKRTEMALAALLRRGALSVAENKKLRARLDELAELKQSIEEKSSYYRHFITKIMEKEIELRAELEILKKKSAVHETKQVMTR